MAEELGKIEKPPVEKYKRGRKLFFVPVIYHGESSQEDYLVKFNRYWEQVTKQTEELAAKLGEVKKVYHELIAVAGEEGVKAVKELNNPSYILVKACMDKKGELEALEDADLLMEYMDWSRCMLIGLQSPRVANKIFDAYVEVGKKRNEYISRKIDETLKEDETGIVLMRENHHIQFPADIQVFYVAPPALDEIKRWFREQEGKSGGEKDGG
jgi:hypothetical protein